jgi:hypothetical protein
MRLFPQYLPYWGYIPILKPNAAAFGAIRHDVQSPWTKPAKKTVGWRIGKGRTSYKLYKLTTPLDGEARISISGAPGARFRIRGVLSKKAAPSRLADYHKRSASLLVCGNRTAAFKVRRLAGTGKLHVKLSRP